MNKQQDKTLETSGAESRPASDLAVNPPSGSTPTGAPLADFLQRQTQHRVESAKAFEQNKTSEPSMREMLEEQVKLQRQVRSIKNHVLRVQQGLLICQILNVLIAGALVAIAAFLYLRPEDATPWSTMPESSKAWLQANEKKQSEWPIESDKTEKPNISTDQIFMISNFMNRAKRLKLDVTDVPSKRSEKKAGYIRLLVDLSEKGEELATQHASTELCEILIKVAKYAKGTQSYEQDTQEQLDLYREINKFCAMN